jgi:protein-S-isoprenylcysteine O-methyltransferase Ste14
MKLVPVVHQLLERVALVSHADDATSSAVVALTLAAIYWASAAVKAGVVSRRTGESIHVRSAIRAERVVLAIWAGDVAFWFLNPILLLSGVHVLVTPLWYRPALARLGAVLGAGAIAWSWLAWIQMGDSWRMATSERRLPLVTSGVFGRVRHPIYVAQATLVIAMTLMMPSPAMLAVSVVHVSCVYSKVVLEERHLLGVHGAAYRAYVDTVGRFFPRAKPPLG